ncbi:ComEC/Rec2 family competence protein [Oceanobacillus halophilus]|uniref:MBL fold metallo-hydrolase n=1 Tax=Oceanobacillus halophilus TaxID=930130 RepID=A0A494ZY09_9BACI|nr:MBL fold metallo-hydrolase [Oceanobacillus halophilus]RKQ31385.1 MBL fold metallo-hydrolase [Oceanobacillus halophilus]
MKKFQVAIILMLFITPIHSFAEPKPDMDVHFIDVGQGDSILIETPSGKTILIDGGPPEAGDKVVNYLKDKEIREIDLLIATHPDFDHIGGLVKVMKSIEVKQILDTGKVHLTRSFAKYVSEIRKQKIPTKIAKKNQRIRIDRELRIKVLNSQNDNNSNNESSIVLKISYDDIDFLLMGDVKMEQERSLMEKYDISADIIKVAHHGSDTSTSLAFLEYVKPQIAILTYRVGNDYGHPVERVIENLERIDANIYSTAAYGDVVIKTNGYDYFVFPKRSPSENILRKTS